MRDAWWLDPSYRYGDAIFTPRGMSADELSEGPMRARQRLLRLALDRRPRAARGADVARSLQDRNHAARQLDFAARDRAQAGQAAGDPPSRRSRRGHCREAHADQAHHRPHDPQPLRGRGAHGAAEPRRARRADARGRRRRDVRRPHGADPVSTTRPTWSPSRSRPIRRAAPTRSPTSIAGAACRSSWAASSRRSCPTSARRTPTRSSSATPRPPGAR